MWLPQVGHFNLYVVPGGKWLEHQRALQMGFAVTLQLLKLGQLA